MALSPPSMKISFTEFMNLCEVYDKDVMGSSQIRKSGEGGRLYPSRKKTAPEKRRVKAIGGGKTAPAKDYKPRKDIGTQGAGRGTSSQREQQPTQTKGVKLSAKEQQRKAYLERKKRESATKGEVSGKDKSIDLKKSADKLLAVKKKKEVNPNYKPAKASGLTRQERMTLHRKGETKLRNIMKDQEMSRYKKETGQDPDKKAKTKILGRVHKRMST